MGPGAGTATRTLVSLLLAALATVALLVGPPLLVRPGRFLLEPFRAVGPFIGTIALAAATTTAVALGARRTAAVLLLATGVEVVFLVREWGADAIVPAVVPFAALAAAVALTPKTLPRRSARRAAGRR